MAHDGWRHNVDQHYQQSAASTHLCSGDQSCQLGLALRGNRDWRFCERRHRCKLECADGNREEWRWSRQCRCGRFAMDGRRQQHWLDHLDRRQSRTRRMDGGDHTPPTNTNTYADDNDRACDGHSPCYSTIGAALMNIATGGTVTIYAGTLLGKCDDCPQNRDGECRWGYYHQQCFAI